MTPNSIELDVNDRNPEGSGRPRLRWREPMPDRNG